MKQFLNGLIVGVIVGWWILVVQVIHGLCTIDTHGFKCGNTLIEDSTAITAKEGE